MRRAFERAGVPVAVLDSEGVIVSCSDRFTAMLGTDRDRTVGSQLVPRCPVGQQAEVLAMLARVLEGVSEVEHLELVPTDASEPLGRVRASLSAVESPSSRIDQVLVVLEAVSGESTAERRRRVRSESASLVPDDRYRSVVDHRTLCQIVDLARGRVQRSASPIGVLRVQVLGLDSFSGATDSDLVELASVYGSRIDERLRDTDQVARVGDAEYFVVAEDLGDVQDAAGVAYRLLSAMVEPVEVSGRTAELGMTIGIAVADASASTGRLLRESQRALDEARGDGSGGFRIVDLHSSGVGR